MRTMFRFVMFLCVVMACGQRPVPNGGTTFVPGPLQPARVSVRGACLVIHTRVGSGPDTYDDSWCDRAARPGGVDGQLIRTRYHWAIDFLSLAFDNAERALCRGAEQCVTRGRHARVILIPEPTPAALTYRRAEDPTIIFSIGLLDFLESANISYFDELGAAGTGLAWPNTLRSLLGIIQRGGGRPCHYGAPSMLRVLSDAEFGLTRYHSMAGYMMVFAHELSHLTLGPSCGVQGSEAEQEMACDRNAVEHLASTVQAPIYPFIAFMITMAHYEAVVRGIVSAGPGASAASGAPQEVSQWHARAAALAGEWERLCGSAPEGSTVTVSMCGVGWRSVAQDIRALLALPLPTRCDASSSRQGELRADYTDLQLSPNFTSAVPSAAPTGNHCFSVPGSTTLLCAPTLAACETLRQGATENSGARRPEGLGPCRRTVRLWCGSYAQPDGQRQWTCDALFERCLMETARLRGSPPSFPLCVLYALPSDGEGR